MTDTRWKIRRMHMWAWLFGYEYVGVRDGERIYGYTKADVMNRIAVHEGEQP